MWKDDIADGWMDIHMYEQMHAVDPFVLLMVLFLFSGSSRSNPGYSSI